MNRSVPSSSIDFYTIKYDAESLNGVRSSSKTFEIQVTDNPCNPVPLIDSDTWPTSEPYSSFEIYFGATKRVELTEISNGDCAYEVANHVVSDTSDSSLMS